MLCHCVRILNQSVPLEKEQTSENICLLGCCALIALMMEVESTSETSVNFYQTTRRNNPEDNHLHTRHRENLKSHLAYISFFTYIACIMLSIYYLLLLLLLLFIFIFYQCLPLIGSLLLANTLINIHNEELHNA
jgi:hypothetical protein